LTFLIRSNTEKCGVPPQRGPKSIANIDRGHGCIKNLKINWENLHYKHYSFFLRGGQTPLPPSMGGHDRIGPLDPPLNPREKLMSNDWW